MLMLWQEMDGCFRCVSRNFISWRQRDERRDRWAGEGIVAQQNFIMDIKGISILQEIRFWKALR
jgi:hypothetical protein